MYSVPLFRPPSEAESLIIQITEGCSHNKCTFCAMYKKKQFRLKSDDEIIEHIKWLKKYYTKPERIFLADGNVLCLKTDKIISLLKLIKHEFPTVKRISSYSGPLDLIRKSHDELKLINHEGLELLYMGVESGSDKVLNLIKKGVNQQQMIEAGQKAVESGFKFSCMIISGLGGTELIEEHAVDSAIVVSAINPHYLSMLRLVVEEETELAENIRIGKFHLLTPRQVLEENIIMLENMQLEDCIFRANHISNYVKLAGTLNKDKLALIKYLKTLRDNGNFIPMGFDRI
jgi:radical SAM superfamily enzyme YgiQ (UPF0313 family)